MLCEWAGSLEGAEWLAGGGVSFRRFPGPGGVDQERRSDAITGLGGLGWGGVWGWVLGPPPAEETDEDGLPLMGSGIGLTKVPAIQQKRTVAFLSEFAMHTVQFLNRFSSLW